TMPIELRRKAVRPASESEPYSVPSMKTLPEVGVVSPPSTCSRVLLPLPEAPTIETNSPASTVSETPRSACTCTSPTANVLLIFSARTIAGMSDDCITSPHAARIRCTRARNLGGTQPPARSCRGSDQGLGLPADGARPRPVSTRALAEHRHHGFGAVLQLDRHESLGTPCPSPRRRGPHRRQRPFPHLRRLRQQLRPGHARPGGRFSKRGHGHAGDARHAPAAPALVDLVLSFALRRALRQSAHLLLARDCLRRGLILLDPGFVPAPAVAQLLYARRPPEALPREAHAPGHRRWRAGAERNSDLARRPGLQ